MNGDRVHFCTDNQMVFLRPRGEKTEASVHPPERLACLSPSLAIFVSPSLAGQSSLLPVSAFRINRQGLKVSEVRTESLVHTPVSA